MAEEGKGRVCVTGGTGFIGSWIIKTLLQHGYSVNATVRSHPVCDWIVTFDRMSTEIANRCTNSLARQVHQMDVEAIIMDMPLAESTESFSPRISTLRVPRHKKDMSFLTNLPGAYKKLQILNADLNSPESFKEAIEGCIGVFHVASPMDFAKNEDDEIIIKKSIDGALGILKACLTSKTVKRVIYTSSASASSFNGKEEDDVKDESVWSDVDYLRTCKESGFWFYAISKTLTEKAVLDFGEQNGLDVVTLIPTFVVGPFICPNLPGSILSTLYFAFGDKEPIGYLQTPMVHVDDVARAQIFLLEHPNAKGRYNCSACLATLEKVLQVISVKYPQFQAPSIDSLRERDHLKFPDMSSKKLMDAGFEFKYGLEEMLVDAIACCKETGYL